MADPFTVEHFVDWAGELELDSGDRWVPEDYFLAYLEDVFAGFPISWLIVPEGNAKTTSMAGLALYHSEFVPRAFVPWAASARDQAEIGYQQAKVFAESMPGGRAPRCYDGYRRIQFANGSRIQIFAAGAEHADGVIPTFPMIDEAHRHKNLSLYRTWVGKLAKRGGQLGLFSTAGEPGSEFEEARTKIKAAATDVRDEGSFVRVATDRLVMHEYAVRDTGKVDDMDVVKSANPFSKITVGSLADKFNDPTMIPSHWRRFSCNIASSTDADPYIEPAVWADLGDGDFIPDGAEVCVGADGSRAWDTTVVSWAHRADDGRIDVDAMVFGTVPERPHHVLHSSGKIDFDDVEAFLLGLFDRFVVREAAYDPRYLERSMEIVERRLPSVAINPVEPSSKLMQDALQDFFTASVEGLIRHRGDPVVAAHVANSQAERDLTTRQIRRIRKIDQRKNIDAVPAMALAVWRLKYARASVYEERGVVTV